MRCARYLLVWVLCISVAACGSDDEPGSSAGQDVQAGDVTGEGDGELVGDTAVADIGIDTAAVEDTVEDAAPVEDAVEDTVEDAAPVEDAVEDAAPVEDAVEDAAPVEDAVEDAAPVEDAVEDTVEDAVEDTVEDAAPVEDAVEDAAPVEDAVEDAAPVEDAVEDAAPVEDAVEDAAPVEDAGPTEDIAEACVDPTGLWTIEISSAALPGEGCGKDGTQGQGDDTKAYQIEVAGDGSLVAIMLQDTGADELTVTAELLPSDVGCALLMNIVAKVVFPPGPDGLIDTITASYMYDIVEEDGAVSGTGTFHLTTIADTGLVKVDCTEAITLGGTFEPPG